MTRTMICGSRGQDDINTLVSAGIDAIGLITEVWQKIPCNLSRDQAKELARSMPPFVSSVLVITEEKVIEILRLVEYVSPDAVQLHGFNSPGDVAILRRKLPVKIIKTMHFNEGKMAEEGKPTSLARDYIAAGTDAILVDSYQTDKVGATGNMMDLALAREVREAVYPVPFIMAGGLNAGNVTDVVKTVKPYAVDVFSGVICDGYIDAGRVRNFVAGVNL